MRRNTTTRFLAMVLVLCLMFGNLVSVTAFAVDAEVVEVVADAVTIEEVEESVEGALMELETASEELLTEDYATFLTELKILEGYAESYAATSGKNANELLLNFLRTGVDRYNDGNWKTLAGEEITAFTTYVEEQDAANGTTVMRLRNVEEFNMPNGQGADFGHMFGTMNISLVNPGSADIAGWAGDICDLLTYSYNYGNVPEGTVEEMAAYILENCFGVDADDAFGMDDFYGDMDGFYLVAQMKAGTSMSAAVEAYFTASLSDADRAEYFMENRFEDLYTKESVREAVYSTYSADVAIQVLEAGRGLSALTDLRQACCYAFADYLYQEAGDRLEEPTEDPEDPTPDEPEQPEEPEAPEVGDNPYYSVFSSTDSVLAPGITQTIRYAQTADNKQIVYYVATVDVTRDDVTIMANYHDADPSKGWAMQRVTDQVAALEAKHTNPEDAENYIENFRAIVSTNGAGFNMSTGEPSGLLVMGGKEWHEINNAGFFAIMKDGSAKIGTTAEYAECKDQVQEAIAGFGAVLIKDGVIVASGDTSRASRTAIGIKADGSVVMMVLDGRQEPFSAGGSYAEIAQIMKDAGCIEAINLDGGGSTTYAAKPEGSDEVVVVNRPSDGYQRSVSTSLCAVSTAVTSKEFSYANVSTEYDYLTVGTSLELTAVGVSESGSSAEIPEGATWAVSDSALGTVSGDTFTAAALGDVEVQLVLDDQVLGSKTLHVVVPDALSMKYASMNVVYDTPTKLPLEASYNGNTVAFNDGDVYVLLQYRNAGKTEGQYVTVYEEAEYRTLLAGAALMSDFSITAMLTLNCYRADEAQFDFDNATSGDEKFAWIREVTNAEQHDDVYQIVDTKKTMDVSYVFALDMESIEIPEKLRSLTSMLPGGDNTDKTAWEYLLNLAERVSTLTTVNIVAQFDPDMELDVSEMTVSNDFFEFESAEVDETTNTVTIKATWIDRTQAVDPSTASSLCILSGIRATPKDGAQWDAEDQIDVVNVGEVKYKIYLRASSLYSFAKLEVNQQQYGLYPFSRTLEDGSTESGAYFEDTYATFEDSFTLDSTNRQGWYTYDDQAFYFVDNVPVTGTQLVPGYEDPANQYFYNFAEDGSCLGTVTGLINLNGDIYYAINGARKTGWISVMNGGKVDYYFFNTWSYKAVDGVQKINGYTYTFTDHVLTRGDLVVNSTGTRYMWAGQWATQEWLNIDGKIAYARSSAYFQTGLTHRYSPEGVWTYYAFTDDGWWMKDFSGIYEWNGGTYLIKEGIVIDYPGLFEMDGDYYYISSTNVMVKNRQYWISKTNGIVPEGSYWFDEDGKMTMLNQPDPEEPEVPDEPDEPDTPVTPEPVKNGIVEEEGKLVYYKDGNLFYAGLIEIDGYYYYVRTTGELVVSRKYWITKNNGLMKSALYEFDDQGRMIIPDEPDTPVTPDPEPEVKNGIVAENDGLYYYVDGVLKYAGLIKIGDYYYYVRTNGQLVVGRGYWITKNNGLMPSKSYQFDDQGRMIIPETEPEDPDVELKNGIISENGGLFYYVDGRLTYAGLIKIGDDYYYVRTSGQLAAGCDYWVTKNNDLLPSQLYTFDEQGRMQLDFEPSDPSDEVKNGIVRENGGLYYYEDGVLTYAGLIYLDGYYYYVRTSGQLAADCKYWPTKTNGYFTTTRQYTFDSEGRMVDPPV